MARVQEQQTGGYMLAPDGGVIDVWWPYQPRVARYTIKVASDQTEGRLCQLLARDRRGGAPPLHIHHNEDETFFVIAGEMRFVVGDQRIDATAGDFVFAPRKIPHAYLVTSEHAEYLASFSPAGAEHFFAQIAPGVVSGGPTPAPVQPDPATFARIAADYGIEILGPPPTSVDDGTRSPAWDARRSPSASTRGGAANSSTDGEREER